MWETTMCIQLRKRNWKPVIGKRFFSPKSIQKIDNSFQTSTVSLMERAPEPQAPNRATIWSKRQQPRSSIVDEPRFLGIDMSAQPRPLAAIELLKQQPATCIEGRSVYCDGGGLLGHPKVFINLVS